MAATKENQSGKDALHSSQIRPFLKSARKGDKLKDPGTSMVLIADGNGGGKWLFQGRVRGDKTLIDLVCGYWPQTSLSEARAKREEFKLKLRQGINPNQEKREEIAAARQEEENAALTFSVVAEEYFSKKIVSAKTLQSDRGRVVNHIAQFIGNMPIASIRRRDLRPIIDTLVEKDEITQAGRVAGLVERIFKYALDDAQYIDASPASNLKGLVPRKPASEEKHHPAITEMAGAAEMFKKIFGYLESGRSGSSIRAAMALHMYLPIRNGNMIEAEWEHVDLERMLWTFPKSKNGKPYVLPITTQIKKVFDDLAQYRRCKWCFPSGSTSGHISNGGLTKVLREAGIPKGEMCLHGFRSTFKSLCEENGLPSKLVEKFLFHVSGDKMDKHYNRTQYEEGLRQVIGWWNDCVDAMRTDQPVPPMPEELRGKFIQ